MKRILSVVLASLLLLCSCSAAKKYEKAYTAATERKEFTVKVENTLTVKGEDGSEETYKENVRYTQSGGALCAKVDGEDGYIEYYYKDGSVYSLSEAGEFSWSSTSDEFFSEFCYGKPLDHSFEKGEKDGDALVFRAELDGNEHKDRLLGLNPAFEDFKISEASVTAFTYSVSVKDGAIKDYIFDFTVEASSGEEKATLTNVMKVTYEDKADTVTMPEGYVGFEVINGNILDISEEEFTREVMLIILEALYNDDGTRKDDFDATYAEFAAMYGEETMSTFIAGIEEFNASIGLTP